MNIRRRLLPAASCLAILAGGTAIPAANAATTATDAPFPAIGTYQPSGGLNLDGETVLADIVTITPSGLPRFEVIIQYTNRSNSIQTNSCVLPNGVVKTAADTWLTIHGVNGTVTLKGVDSTCGEHPGYKDVLAPGQTDTNFVAFSLPPALGTVVQVSTLFGNSSGGVSRYYTGDFDPYTNTTGLRIIEFRPASAAIAQLILDGRDLFTDGRDMVNSLRGIEVFGDESITVLDVNLILPWVACGNAACVRQLTPSPYLPEMSSG